MTENVLYLSFSLCILVLYDTIVVFKLNKPPVSIKPRLKKRIYGKLVIARKLGREKKIWKGEGEGRRGLVCKGGRVTKRVFNGRVSW